MTELSINPYHRQLIWLAGDEDAHLQQLASLYQQVQDYHDEASRWLYVGEPNVHFSAHSTSLGCEHILASQTETILGREFNSIIINAYSGFSPNALGAVSGTLRAGGYLFLVAPSIDDWPSFADPDYKRFLSWPYQAKDATGYFLRYVCQCLSQLPDSQRFESALLPDVAIQAFTQQLNNGMDAPYQTQSTDDQQEAIAALIRVVKGHRKRPLVITADRGRGKSAALGMAAAQLMATGNITILVTAPSRKTVATVFQHLQANLKYTVIDQRGDVYYADAKCCYIAPDELYHDLPAADYVLVDEAAALPVSLLKAYLKHYSRIAFATTQHGYEGSGQGFDLRFKQHLDETMPQWKAITLQQPIRWLLNDPLEALTHKLLLLDAEAYAFAEPDFSPILNARPLGQHIPRHLIPDMIEEVKAAHYNIAEDCQFSHLDRSQLIANDSLLHELFGLLVSAHYQTRPSDLRWLLDSPDVNCFILSYQQHVVAVAVTIDEGGLDKMLASHIDYGQRRPQGHLVAQTLAAQAGMRGAARLTNRRIVRIAVHAQYRGVGLGQKLVNHMTNIAGNHDYLCTSFGASYGLLKFWQACGYKAVRLGSKRDQASGRYSVVMLQALSPKGQGLYDAIRLRFSETFPWLLQRHYQTLSVKLIIELLKTSQQNSHYTLSEQDEHDIEAFMYGRAYETAEYALYKRTMIWLTTQNHNDKLNFDDNDKALLVEKLLRNKAWSAIELPNNTQGQTMGKKALKLKLRELIKTIMTKIQ